MSSGYPGGPQAGFLHAERSDQQYDIGQAMPEVHRLVQAGDIAGARQVLDRVGVRGHEAWLARHVPARSDLEARP